MPKEAEHLYRRSLSIKEKVLGADHPLTQATQEWFNAVQQAMLEK